MVMTQKEQLAPSSKFFIISSLYLYFDVKINKWSSYWKTFPLTILRGKAHVVVQCKLVKNYEGFQKLYRHHWYEWRQGQLIYSPRIYAECFSGRRKKRPGIIETFVVIINLSTMTFIEVFSKPIVKYFGFHDGHNSHNLSIRWS